MGITHNSRLARRVRTMSASMTQAITAKAKSLKADGIDMISFGAGEPDFDTPKSIKEAGENAIKEGFTKYTDVTGITELKKAIVDKFERDQGLHYDIEQIIVTCGAKHALYNLTVSLFEEDDEIILPAPYWVTYPEQILLAGATPVIVKTSEENNFSLNIEDLQKAVTKKTKAIILNSPNNPTGEILSAELLSKIAEFAVENGIYVISDECYEKLIFDGNEHVCIASLGEEIKDQTIIVNAVSKAYSMTGWRIGYAAGPKEIIKAMGKVQSHATSNPTSISQKAALEALNGPQDAVEKMVGEFEKRRNHMVECLSEIEDISFQKPPGAFYVFPNVSNLYGRKYNGEAIKGSIDFSNFLLDVARVAVIPGIGFGSDNHIRLSFPYSLDTISKGVSRIKEAISKLES